MTGERREGVYYGLWAFLTKFTSALGVAVSGWALDLFGYVPNVAQTTPVWHPPVLRHRSRGGDSHQSAAAHPLPDHARLACCAGERTGGAKSSPINFLNLLHRRAT